MDECLMDLFALSLGGGVVTLVLMGVARVTRARYAAKWRCVIWALLCLRLIILLPLVPQVQAPVQMTVPQMDRPVAVSAAPTVAPNTGTAPQIHPDEEEKAPALTMSHIVSGVWLLGMCGVLVWSGVSHMRLRRYLRRWASVETREEVCCRYAAQAQRLNLKRVPKLLACPGLEVPMLTGLVAPALMLPQNASSEDGLDYALLHELIHYRRRDIWLKALVMLTVSVHWFNPVMWLMVRQVDRDIELACDEMALTVLPEEERLAYGETILQAAARVHRQT
ncbi:M56 family metallopeptidase [Pseudoflavonifractor capillosus]|uniref:M56 family metallopeptidase n=1 Tax=Pseudoflavonifractor capillosus TaxID=106588 RepID=UPI001958ABE0|nr:M56 family metallopeptidase [Pseudoflavonifractor capillosus]MBM6693511.1 M56 family metallopeptidase [Pseudoflavonifractor capillosus]